MEKGLVADSTTVVMAMAVAHIEEGIQLATVIVDVETCLCTLACVGTCLYGTEVACLAVFFQHNVDDACRTFCGEFGRRIVDDLNALDALSGQLLQDLRLIVAGQTTCLTIDPNLYTAVAAQGDITFLVNLYRRDILQHVGSRAAGIADLLVHIERLAVNLQFHLLTLSRHRYFFQLMGIFRQEKGSEMARTC